MERLTAISLRWPRLTLLIALVVSVVSAVVAAQVPINAGAYAYIGKDHAAVRDLEAFIERFGGGYPVVIAWSCGQPNDPCKSVFDDTALLMAARVGNELTASASVSRVSSPAHTPLLVATPDGVLAHRFVSDGTVDAPPLLAKQAAADPNWNGVLVSHDARVGALIIEMPTTDITAQFALIDEIERLLEAEKKSGFAFSLSGSPWVEAALYRGTAEGTQVVGAATGLLIAMCIAVFLRSWQSVVAVLVSIGMGSACAVGVLPLLGWVRNPITTAAPTLVLVMGVADAIHFLTSYWSIRRDSVEREFALAEAARQTQWPCVMTTLTNVAGLVSFLGTESPAIGQFGVIAAAGVTSCLILTFTVLPAIVVLLPDAPGPALTETNRWDGILQRVIGLPLTSPIPVLGAILALTVTCGIGLTQLEVDPSALRAFKPDDPTRKAIEWVSSNLKPLEGVELELTSFGPITEPEVFLDLLEVESRLRSVAGSGRMRSITTILDSAGLAFVGQHVNPHNAGDVLGLLSLTDGGVLEPWASLDLRHVRISIDAGSMKVEQRRRLIAAITAEVERLPPGWSYIVTGPTALHLAIDGAIEATARQSVFASVTLVSLLVMLFLRSVRWGALAMVPNLVPLVILFGLMGLWGIPLDGGSVVVAPIAIGIAVDDTIHILHHFARARRRGVASVAAVREATRHCGRAVLTTSCALALGFLAMTASKFQTVANIGILSAAAISAAAMSELLLLPSLLSLFSRFRREDVRVKSTK